MPSWTGSVFIAGLFVLYGGSFEQVPLCTKLGKSQEANKAARHLADMKKVIDRHGWDGDWFIRAYDHFGEKTGSNKCEEGKIFIESQGKCIMAGIGLEDGRARKALDSVKELFLNGKKIPGSLVPISNEGSVQEVKVVMG